MISKQITSPTKELIKFWALWYQKNEKLLPEAENWRNIQINNLISAWTDEYYNNQTLYLQDELNLKDFLSSKIGMFDYENGFYSDLYMTLDYQPKNYTWLI